MTVVLVHGVPETPAVWEPLVALLGRTDVETLRLPGFGGPAPVGFGATKEEYVAWLGAELERIGAAGPVDLVGHDWGGGFVVRVVSTRPDLVRSWVTDAGAIGEPGFEWHDFAKIWQTPGEGEEFFAQQLATPVDDSATVFEAGPWPDGPTRGWPGASSPSTGRPWTWAPSGVPISRRSPPRAWPCSPPRTRSCRPTAPGAPPDGPGSTWWS
jgi:pimeloyl-ACP methyl ester carboxylesterase